ncbi:hypothetical protein SDC9_79056 [bioreactor metagenome]|uniref:Uncharacterized protein n=1 Tax=bioreactor metagenome TaxID=1076179 RepID=A0A644Z187_9ZZZZ
MFLQLQPQLLPRLVAVIGLYLDGQIAIFPVLRGEIGKNTGVSSVHDVDPPVPNDLLAIVLTSFIAISFVFPVVRNRK